MSMLAERKEKRKWSVDPRGTNWSKDDDKFGLKMLEKMGWTKGKGLGVKEDGMTDHLKVKHKSDNCGMGYTLNDENNWVAHQDDFSSLLAQLNEHHADANDSKADNEVTNLEKNSKSQKRVHYQKFTRGKDLSNYKVKDLAAIFGKPASQSAPTTPLNLSEDGSDADSCSSCPVKRKKKKKEKTQKEDISRSISDVNEATNHVTSMISVQEYFAQRMALLKKNQVDANCRPMDSKKQRNKVRKNTEALQNGLSSCENGHGKISKKTKKQKRQKGTNNQQRKRELDAGGRTKKTRTEKINSGLNIAKDKKAKKMKRKGNISG